MSFNLKPLLGVQLSTGHPLLKGLVGYWVMNEGSGNKVYDLSGYGHVGTFINDVGWRIGGVDLPGSDDYIEFVGLSDVLESRSIDNQTFFLIYEYDSSPTGYSTLLTRGQNTPTNDLNGLYLLIESATGKLWNWQKEYANLPSGWDSGLHKIVYSFPAGGNKGDGSFWYDGVKLTTVVSTGNFTLAANESWRIGSGIQKTTHEFDGLVSTWMAYQRCLTSSEIQSLCINPYAMFEDLLPIWLMAYVTAFGGGGRRNNLLLLHVG